MDKSHDTYKITLLLFIACFSAIFCSCASKPKQEYSCVHVEHVRDGRHYSGEYCVPKK